MDEVFLDTAHCRVARGGFNRRCFEEQMAVNQPGFEDAVGTVLQVLEPVKESAWLWFQQWKAGFCSKVTKPAKPVQNKLNFSLQPTIRQTGENHG